LKPHDAERRNKRELMLMLSHQMGQSDDTHTALHPLKLSSPQWFLR